MHTKLTLQLSSDGYTYRKVFNSNNIYVTPVQDVNGILTNVDMDIFYK